MIKKIIASVCEGVGACFERGGNFDPPKKVDLFPPLLV